MINTILNEYKSLLRSLQNMQSEIGTLPQGYISKKTIHNKQYFYLQSRVNGKIISKYIKPAEVDDISKQIDLLKKYKAKIPQIKKRISELEQAAKLIDKNLVREFTLLKLSANMDYLTADQKEKSASFANAMNSIEGVNISNITQNRISDWKNGNTPFLTIFNETLTMYGFPTEVDNA